VQIAEVREALESLSEDPQLAWGETRAIDGRGSYWTFAVEPGCIFRFPKRDEVADDLRKQIRLLPELREGVDFEVPRFEWQGRYAGRPFVGYRRVPGRALRAADLSLNGPGPAQHRANARERLAQSLAQLHGFPKRRAGEILGVRDPVARWTARYQALEVELADRVLPLLPAGLRAGVVKATSRFQEAGLPQFSHPVLVHADLGSEHILVDDQTGACTGIIDFEDATLGDPVIDFVGLWLSAGKQVTGDVLARYGGPHDSGFGERLHFYQWMGSAHAILHGLQVEDHGLVSDGIAALEARIERPAFGDVLEF
jgi:aminoglycoside 2''-phosphotransferase